MRAPITAGVVFAFAISDSPTARKRAGGQPQVSFRSVFFRVLP
jgi:hypothetical protein